MISNITDLYSRYLDAKKTETDAVKVFGFGSRQAQNARKRRIETFFEWHDSQKANKWYLKAK